MKRFWNILILLSMILFAFICISGTIKLDCIFKKVFGISCPSCGLTRSIKEILKLDIVSSFKYNIFGPIVFLIIIIFLLLIIKDIIRNENTTITNMYKLLGKYYYIIITCLIISMVINNIRGI